MRRGIVRADVINRPSESVAEEVTPDSIRHNASEILGAYHQVRQFRSTINDLQGATVRQSRSVEKHWITCFHLPSRLLKVDFGVVDVPLAFTGEIAVHQAN